LRLFASHVRSDAGWLDIVVTAGKVPVVAGTFTYSAYSVSSATMHRYFSFLAEYGAPAFTRRAPPFLRGRPLRVVWIWRRRARARRGAKNLEPRGVGGTCGR